MLKSLFLAFSLIVAVQPVVAQTLQDQIATVRQAQDDEARRMAEYQQQVANQAARQEANRRAAIAAQERKREVEQAARRAEMQAERQRDQGYEDQQRSIALERQRLEVKREAARVARENEYIDAELKRRNAQTDVVQSEADANRNVSSGLKGLLEKGVIKETTIRETTTTTK